MQPKARYYRGRSGAALADRSSVDHACDRRVQPDGSRVLYFTRPAGSDVDRAVHRARGLPKEAWLTHRGIAGSWPCWGFPARIHLDNAKEFHGEMLRRACEQYGIALDYRPPATPHMGGTTSNALLAR
jgi:transposase InsO family protein